MNRTSLVNDALQAGRWAALLSALFAPACQSSGDAPDTASVSTTENGAPSPGQRPPPATPECDRSKQFCGDTPPIAQDPTTLAVASAPPHGRRLSKVQSAEDLVRKYREAPESEPGPEAVRAASPEVLRSQALYLDRARELDEAYDGEELVKRKLELKRSLFPQVARER